MLVTDKGSSGDPLQIHFLFYSTILPTTHSTSATFRLTVSFLQRSGRTTDLFKNTLNAAGSSPNIKCSLITREGRRVGGGRRGGLECPCYPGLQQQSANTLSFPEVELVKKRGEEEDEWRITIRGNKWYMFIGRGNRPRQITTNERGWYHQWLRGGADEKLYHQSSGIVHMASWFFQNQGPKERARLCMLSDSVWTCVLCTWLWGDGCVVGDVGKVGSG